MPNHQSIPVQKRTIINQQDKQTPTAPSALIIETEKRIKDALQLHQSGNFAQAQIIYTEILNAQPSNFSALQLMGMLYLQTSQYQNAIDYLKKAIKVNSRFIACHTNLGIAYQSLNKYEEALSSYKKALEIDPNHAETYSNQGVTLYSLKRYDEALTSYERAISLKPNYADAYSNRGNALQALKRYDEALRCYSKAIKIRPEYVDAHLNLGNTLNNLKRYDEALKSYERAIALKPDQADLYYSIGNHFQMLENYGSALACYERAIKLNSYYVDAFLNKGAVLQRLKRLDEALICYDTAIQLKPSYVLAHSNRGFLLKELKRYDEALACFDKALKENPKDTKLYTSRGLVLLEQFNFEEALKTFKTAIDLEPQDPLHYKNYGVVLNELLKPQEAIQAYRKAAILDPMGVAHHNILWIKSSMGIVSPLEYLDEAKNWEKAWNNSEHQPVISRNSFRREPLKKRRLRVGYVSGDFFYHVISFFMEGIFRDYDRSRLEVFAYSNGTTEDETTQRIMSLVDYWVPVSNLKDDELHERILDDQIDILIDLAGFTANNRMALFAKRAAPIQAHYLGYPSSTGLTQMDYWIGDANLTPLHIQKYFSEQIWQLPRVWVSYLVNAKAPEIKWEPSKDGSICIGSLNKLIKLTDITVSLWSRILNALPNAYLLLNTKSLINSFNQKQVYEWFNRYGIANDRIKLQNPNADYTPKHFLTVYDQIDVALDPFGASSGGTTTCDALLMGVPVITLVKEDSPVSARITASMLCAVGHPEWIAHSEEEYIEKVVTLAKNVNKRKALRFEQRNRLLQSPLCDSKGLAHALEDAYEAMFNKWYHENQALEEANILN